MNHVPHVVQVINASFPSGHAMISSTVRPTLALLLVEAIERKNCPTGQGIRE